MITGTSEDYQWAGRTVGSTFNSASLNDLGIRFDIWHLYGNFLPKLIPHNQPKKPKKAPLRLSRGKGVKPSAQNTELMEAGCV